MQEFLSISLLIILAAISPGRDQVFDQVAAEEATETLREARVVGE